MSKQILLHGIGGTGKITTVSDEDYDFLSSFKWYFSQGYAVRTWMEEGKGRRKFLHRELIEPDLGYEVDHINRNKLDNTRENLRIVTHSENMANTTARPLYGGKPTSSVYKGVWKLKRESKYSAEIYVEGIKYRLGRYLSEEDAARAYDRAALHFFGSCACLNFAREQYEKEGEWQPYRPSPQYSNFTGVSLNKQTGSWVAHMWADGKKCHLGTFKSEIEAAKAYDKRASMLPNSKRKLNFG